MKTIIKTKDAPAPIGPYNQAVLANNTLYISGQIGLKADGETFVNVNIMAETEQVLYNLRAVLKAAKMDISHVVKCSIFVTNLDHFDAVNATYASFFNAVEAPARETVQVVRLPKGARVEISAIACKEG
jgi:2-iminobutanoate/2-iminopropanoate deaminase